jgi:hypothetical protein
MKESLDLGGRNTTVGVGNLIDHVSHIGIYSLERPMTRANIAH